MLIDEPMAMHTDMILAAIATMNGNDPRTKKLCTGVYEIGHFGGSQMMSGYEHYTDGIDAYGVCDSVEQLLAACPELEAPGRRFVVTVTPVKRANQPADGGWRWHKWGDYIGTQNPQHEYLYDDVHIDMVLCYHIFEKV